MMQLAFYAVGQQFETRSDVADNLGMREMDLFDMGGRVADMDHLRTVRAHMKGGFSIVSCPIAMIRSARSTASCT